MLIGFERGSLKAQTAATLLASLAMILLCLATASLFVSDLIPRWVAGALIVQSFVACVAALGAYLLGRPRGRQPKTPAALRETAQWRRWQNCLFTWPVVMTNYALLAASSARNWETARTQPLGVAFAVLLPLVIVAMMAQILPFRRGERGTPQRRQFDALADELSREHGLRAFRSGYFAFLLGAVGTVLVAYFARQWIGYALIAALWLGFVVPCVHFGVLQRLAEGEDD